MKSYIYWVRHPSASVLNLTTDVKLSPKKLQVRKLVRSTLH